MKVIYSLICLPFLLIMLFVNSSEGSSDWVELKTNRGNTYSYNHAGIKNVTQDVFQVWIKTIYSDEGKERHLQYMRKQELSVTLAWDKLSDRLSLVEMDCRKGMTRGLSVTYYDKDGGVLYSQAYDEQNWKPVTAGSLFDILQKKVCK